MPQSLAPARRAARASVVATACAALPLLAPALHAQRWRTLAAERQRAGRVDTLHVSVPYGAGTLALGAAPRDLLYDVRLRYDADQFRPREHYDPATHTLTVGADSATARLYSLDPRSGHVSRGSDVRHGSELTLGLPAAVPLDLSLELAAAEARVDLTGLTVARLRLRCAATDTRITFDAPNPAPTAELDLESTVAGLTVRRLGDAHAAVARVSARLGGVDLDLAGAWTGTMRLDLRVLLGGANVRVPSDAGVQVRLTKLFGSLDAPGYVQRGDSYFSPNWSAARRKVVIDADATLAGVAIKPATDVVSQ